MSITSVVNDTVTSVSVINALKPLPPTITNYSVGGLDDTALDPAGGQTVQINGTGFLAGATITFDGNAVAVVTYVNPNRLTFTSPAKSAGTYTIYVVNPDGGTAIFIPGIIYSVLPTWTTSAGTLGSYYETTSISNTVVASGDAPITYSLYSGSLPTGSTLYANGVITGTAPVDSSSTTYSFTIEAIDAQLQGSTRSFSLTINVDAVTWVSPANATTYTSAVDSAIANVALSATDAAGYAVSYSANALPTGLTLTGSNIAGTPTVIADSSTLLTATAATTNRTAVRTINWSITVANDVYFEYNTLLIPGASTTFVDDASTNNFAVTINGDTKPNNFNPYTPGYYSNYFDGTGDYLSLSNNAAFQFGTGDFTVELYYYPTALTGSPASYQSIIGMWGGGTGQASWLLYLFNGNLYWYTSTNGSTQTATFNATSGMTINNWYHLALVRSSGTTTIYVNGTSIGSTATVVNLYAANCTLTIAYNPIGGTPDYVYGYLSNIRIVKGIAVYTGSFTVPTSPLAATQSSGTNIAAITGTSTSLLTSQSTTFIDNSTNNFTITVAGNTSISSFDPFVPNSSYSTYGSGYFDGTGDYLNTPANAAFALGTGDFTLECWIYVTAAFGTSGSGRGAIISNRTAASGNTSFVLQHYNGNIYFGTVSTDVIVGTTTMSINRWYHVAITRSSGTVRLFLNGVSDATAVTGNTTNFSDTSAVYIGIDGSYSSLYPYTGYITDTRIVKGTAVYTTTFTPPAAPLTAIANTSLLTLQNNQSVNNSTFLDNSTNNFFVTRNGNTTQGTFSPYGGNWSNYFDGTGDNLSLATATALGTGNTTVEFWFYPTDSSATYRAIYDSRSTVNTDTGYAIFQYGLTIEVYGNGLKVATSASAFTVNNWVYVALVRTSGTCQLYINGVASGSSGTYSANLTSTVRKIGDSVNTLFPYIGYISNLREVTSALYSGTFTPSTTPLTAIANTSLLTCQSNRIVDTSINNFTITKAGDTSVQRFSPFNPSSVTPTSYSGYFDGTGDYLISPYSSGGQLGSNNFTIEFWIYFSSVASGQQIISAYTSTNLNYAIYTASNGTLNYYLSSDGTTWNIASGLSFGNISVNTWYHVALVRNGSTFTPYLNGTAGTTATSSSAIFTNTLPTYIGAYFTTSASSFFTGYISNLRIVNGTAVYTTTFTPPTTPLTAIANTSLLTLQSPTFIDNSTNNFTITAVGNSQPTIQNPFGFTSETTNGYTVSTIGGSGYFDGTGDYLTVPSSSIFQITGNFTIEAWVYSRSLGTWNNILSQYANSTNSFACGYNSSSGWYFNYANNGAEVLNSRAGSSPLNAWTHVAFVKSSTTMTVYINGTALASTITVPNLPLFNSTLYIGIWAGALSDPWNGYISDLRLIKGTVYTSNFVPPSAPLLAIQNSSLLLNYTSAGIYDAAMMNNMETVGDAKLSTAIAKFGGSSMSFDGTGDYLSMAAFPTNRINTTGNFTIEFWAYFNTVASNQRLFAWDNNTNNFVIALYTATSGVLSYYLSSTGTSWNVASQVSMGNISATTWTHIALVRNGSVFTPYINGVAGTTTTSSATLTTSTLPFVIGAAGNAASPFNGYIDDLRITKGYARYTANFTPPTSAFPIY